MGLYQGGFDIMHIKSAVRSSAVSLSTSLPHLLECALEQQGLKGGVQLLAHPFQQHRVAELDGVLQAAHVVRLTQLQHLQLAAPLHVPDPLVGLPLQQAEPPTVEGNWLMMPCAARCSRQHGTRHTRKQSRSLQAFPLQPSHVSQEELHASSPLTMAFRMAFYVQVASGPM